VRAPRSTSLTDNAWLWSWWWSAVERCRAACREEEGLAALLTAFERAAPEPLLECVVGALAHFAGDGNYPPPTNEWCAGGCPGGGAIHMRCSVCVRVRVCVVCVWRMILTRGVFLPFSSPTLMCGRRVPERPGRAGAFGHHPAGLSPQTGHSVPGPQVAPPAPEEAWFPPLIRHRAPPPCHGSILILKCFVSCAENRPAIEAAGGEEKLRALTTSTNRAVAAASAHALQLLHSS
jgi:hypothetical protein